MSLNPPSSAGPTRALARAKGLLLTPCAEWERIDAEPETVGRLFVRFVMPLATVWPIALIFHRLVFEHRRPGPLDPGSWLSIGLSAVIAYLLCLVMTYVLALVIDGLAPGFCGCKNRIQAFKVAAYAGAAGWVAGLFGAVPWLGPLVLLGAAYSVYLLYRGLPRLMRTPPERALGYTALTVGAALALGVLVFVCLGSVAAAISSAVGLDDGVLSARLGTQGQTVALPGGGVIDLARLEAAAKQAQLARHGQAGSGAPDSAKALPQDQLKGLLPKDLAGLKRTELFGESRSAAGMTATRATAVYRRSGARVSLRVSDLAAASALAAVAVSFDVERSKQTANGYERVGHTDGRPSAEQFDQHSGHGKFTILVADRFLVEAEGDGVDMDQLKSAAASLDDARLEALARGG